MDIPDDYRGREQSYLKHRVLQEYLSAWGHKLGSLARRRAVKLWYIDCFAGPWKNQHEELRDTSIDIGLRALEQAASTWEAAGYQVETGAIFVEKSRVAYQRLRRYLHGRSGQVDVRALHGEFGQHVGEIARIIGDDPAFVFIDPTGFKGVNMAFIARLAQARMRDVMVNVMFNHINRWKDDPREFLRTQMKDFFGLTDASLSSGLDEEDLLACYRENLKRVCEIEYAADLAVPHPSRERTWFRLVIGGNHPQVLKVFRDVESKVMGREAASIRTGAKARAIEDRTKQLSLNGMAPRRDAWYRDRNQEDRDRAKNRMVEYVSTHGVTPFRTLWPEILQELHVTHAELSQCALECAREGKLSIESTRPRRKTIRDDDRLIPGEE